MKIKIPITLLLAHFIAFQLSAQSTLVKVYELFEQKCIVCHDHDSPEANLDLEGSGSTVQQKAFSVFNNIVEITPSNATAAAKGDNYIYPGRPDRSFLFRKINQGLESTIALDAAEGDPMPKSNPALSNEEKELIRQWILFGAPSTGSVVNENQISNYYNVNGLASFPDGPPDAPDPSEGFQIKMGPFFLNPDGSSGSELEYFQKYELDLPEDLEVKRLDIKISPSSHHFILYNFTSPFFANLVPDGLRPDPDHSGISIVAAVQEATDLRLPERTAFRWENDLILDLNTHYINYSSNNTLMAEAYVNVYTQPNGTALQEMKSELFVNGGIYINNNGNEDVEIDVVNDNFGEVFIWGLMGHTHQWGTGYKVYKRENGQRGDIIYDAACVQGIPGCVAPFFDYQHIPIRYYEPLLPLTFNASNGIEHEATYINNGPNPVQFGVTSDDEMMVLVAMYTSDTTGLSVVTATEDLETPLNDIKVYPNPMISYTTFSLPRDLGTVDITLYDLLGRAIRRYQNIEDLEFTIDRTGLEQGMMIYQIEDRKGRMISGKLLIE